MKHKIACNSLVFVAGKIVGIECAKGRGYILPGGKWEEGETFKQAAARELKEETGLKAVAQKLFFQAMNFDGTYVYTFLTTIKEYRPVHSKEGIVELINWEDLLNSKFKAYYQLLHEKYFHKE